MKVTPMLDTEFHRAKKALEYYQKKLVEAEAKVELWRDIVDQERERREVS